MAKVAREYLEHVLHGLEWFVSRSIPYVMVVLASLIVLDFTIDIHQYEPWVSIVDWTIFSFFIIDLVFKYDHIRNVVKFVKLYWIEIIAVFPFYLAFRVYSELALVGDAVTEAQRFAHGAVLAREAELISKESEVLRSARLFEEAQLATRETTITGRAVKFVQWGFRLVVARFELAKRALLDHSSWADHRHKEINR